VKAILIFIAFIGWFAFLVQSIAYRQMVRRYELVERLRRSVFIPSFHSDNGGE